MRLDKFLWSVRYFKTRSLAADAIKKNKVWVNSTPVKPSKEVTITDEITVRKQQINYSFKVIQIPKSRLGAKLLSMYITDTTTEEELNRLEELKIQGDYYREKGIGRPTKKDRRDLDEFLEEDN